jgi:hypothetical protein
MKYFLSVVCIIKDERYLEEFIMYYHILGVEHFYIYDNESKVPISERLNHYYYDNLCTIINFPGKVQQLNAYNDYLSKYGKETKWVIIIDGDEFILPKNHFSLRDFLKEYDNYHAIGINWVMFGTSFHDKIQEGFVINNYQYCDDKQNKHIKTICKPEQVIKIDNPHYVILKDSNKYVDSHKRIITGPFNENITIDIIQINHYWGKSLEEHYEKRDRGRATTNELRTIIDNPHSKYNKVIDTLICDKYLNYLTKQKNIFRVNWEIYKILNPDLNFNKKEKFYKHLINHGIYENRHYTIKDKYPDFNHHYYKTNYKDLSNLSDIELEKHYLQHGFKEKRIINNKLY